MYDLFEVVPPAHVRRMRKGQLAEEVVRLQAALADQVEAAKTQRQDLEKLQQVEGAGQGGKGGQDVSPAQHHRCPAAGLDLSVIETQMYERCALFLAFSSDAFFSSAGEDLVPGVL